MVLVHHYLLFSGYISQWLNLTNNDYYQVFTPYYKKWIERGSDSDQRIIIDKKSKTQILQQLESFGFNQATLFPEVDIVASFVKFKYLKKLD